MLLLEQSGYRLYQFSRFLIELTVPEGHGFLVLLGSLQLRLEGTSRGVGFVLEDVQVVLHQRQGGVEVIDEGSSLLHLAAEGTDLLPPSTTIFRFVALVELTLLFFQLTMKAMGGGVLRLRFL